MAIFPRGIWLYDHFRPYLHSKTLRWSFGANRGSKADVWQREVAKKPMSELTMELVRTGFTGLHVDLSSYKDNTASFRADLDRVLGPPTVDGKNGTWLFYRLPCPAEGEQ